MRPQKILDKDLITGLVKIFRSKGYEGTSLNEIAEITGLKKASLYHRFPKGKKEMAESVLSHIDSWVEENIFFALSDESKSPKQRLLDGLSQIRALYDEGNETCLFRAFSMQIGLELFEQQIKKGMEAWIDAFAQIGRALHLSPIEARESAIETLIEVQGSLVVTKILKDTTVFDKAIKAIEKRYLN